MKCKKCGKELSDDMVFCPLCGEKIYRNVIDIQEEIVEEKHEPGPWKFFARIGDVLGKVSLCVFWLAGVGINLGVLGIVFSSLGRKSKIRNNMAATGFKRSLIATILALGFITLYALIAIILDIIKKQIYLN